MIIFVVALKAEISWLIEKRDLKLTQKRPFSIYSDGEVAVVISGVGYLNSAIATTYILTLYRDIDKIVNIGVAGAKESISVGRLYSIKKLIDACDDSVYFLYSAIFDEASLTTYSKPTKNSIDLKSQLVDMEGAAFYKSCCHFLKRDRIHIIKIVSDNLNEIVEKQSFIPKLFEKYSDLLIGELF